MIDSDAEPQLDLDDMESVAPWLLAQDDTRRKCEAAREYEWEYIPGYELKELMDHYDDPFGMQGKGRREWAKFYFEEWNRALSERWSLADREELEEEMMRWEDAYFADPESRPIVLVAGPDGLPQVEVWDGIRRIGFAAGRRWRTIPVLLGTPKS